LVVGIYYPTW